ncbi:hypothetical protein QQP08_002241 [Theobroma cacao]|nr:hypothetical protein QQP08_002241 [Theobroma cacao]
MLTVFPEICLNLLYPLAKADEVVNSEWVSHNTLQREQYMELGAAASCSIMTLTFYVHHRKPQYIPSARHLQLQIYMPN